MIPFHKAQILLPKEDLTHWAVVACDQYTSEPAYWERVEAFTEGRPSAAHIIFPECYLGRGDDSRRIQRINETMAAYLDGGVFFAVDGLIYVRRTVDSGQVREGLVGCVDLEAYDYHKGAQSLIRATEGTVLERIPPRVKIREHAPLEMPHIMLLIDDAEDRVFQSVRPGQKLYDFDLMEQGGHIEGYLVADDAPPLAALEALAAPTSSGALLFAVGDGNHSLATAKQCWENIKAGLTDEEQQNHPARYALAEIVNIHSPALQFEPIHRVVFGSDTEKLKALFALVPAGPEAQALQLVENGKAKAVYINQPTSPLTVGSLQAMLDAFLAEHGGEVDYIHGEKPVEALAKDGAVGFLLPAMAKHQLFETVIKDGALPRKTFSMGHAHEKRFYLECRALTPGKE